MIGSDKICSMKESHLVLNLLVHKQDNSTENVLVELTRDELDHLISTLEKAQQVGSM